jgi:hypothetical protein
LLPEKKKQKGQQARDLSSKCYGSFDTKSHDLCYFKRSAKASKTVPVLHSFVKLTVWGRNVKNR